MNPKNWDEPGSEDLPLPSLPLSVPSIAIIILLPALSSSSLAQSFDEVFNNFYENEGRKCWLVKLSMPSYL